MGVGFEAYNQWGGLMISSEQSHTIFDHMYNMDVGYTGDWNYSTKFGNIQDLGYPARDDMYRRDGWIHWIQFTQPGGWAFPGSSLFKPGTARIIRTSRNIRPESGYLDVFDSSGTLIWSAKSASRMPRVTGTIAIDAGYDLENNIVSVNPGYNPFFLWDACCGGVSGDGVVSGHSGALVRWTGSELQVTWSRRNQRDFKSIFNQAGQFVIPYAKFLGHN
ncbi:hypothetical protein KL3_00024 [Klebsiella phage KL3]|nr:hypothetical protein KL3_00024 [Klebsiella phage KL3]